jgi:hypothetical protein
MGMLNDRWMADDHVASFLTQTGRALHLHPA